MGYPPLENLLPKSGYSMYKLVRLAADRAIEIAEGKPALIKTPALSKATTIALEEIAQGKVFLKEMAYKFKSGKTAEKPEEEIAEIPAEKTQ